MNRKLKNPQVGRKLTTAWLAFMAIFIAELFFYTWCRVQYTQVGYEVSDIKSAYQDLLAKRDNLRIELERLKSPERIAKIAEDYLGLTLPKPGQMVTVQ